MSGNQTRCSSFSPSKVATLEYDKTDQTGVLDGSFAELNLFLCELVEMTGQSNGTLNMPVLELQFGDIFTSTILSTKRDVECLSITTLLPRLDNFEYQPLWSPPEMSAIEAGDWECLWHSDAGHYVVVRNIPITTFQNERDVLDAIADTSDQVALWLSRINIARSGMHGKEGVASQAC